MCHWKRAKPDSSSVVAEEYAQQYQHQPQHSSLSRYSAQVNRASNASRRSDRSQKSPPAPGSTMGYLNHRDLPPLPPSTGSLNGAGRASLSSSIRSYSTSQSSRRGPSPSAARSSGGDRGDCRFIEMLPNELLEVIFHLAISSSFPIEDPNWPACPMFSKRSYHHSPSNSGSGYNPVPGTSNAEISSRSRSGSGGKPPFTPTPDLLTSAPHLLPTVLSQTCSRFRMILRNASHLWSYINITRTVSPMQGQQPLMARQLLGWIPIYLARARDAGLHITFDTTKFSSFSAPLSMAMAAPSSASPANGVAGEAIHPQSIFAILLPVASRWTSLTILTSHIGSPTLTPLLHLLSPLHLPSLAGFRVAADIWRPGIVGYGAPMPPLLTGGSPGLRSVVVEGVSLDWKSCAGVDMNGPGLFSALRNLELRFVGGRYPRWEQFAMLLEDGCPQLERLVVCDDFDEALRAIDPPPMSYFEELNSAAHRKSSHSPTSRMSTSSGVSRQTSSSISARPPRYIADLHLTLPPPLPHGSGFGGGGSRSPSASSSSSGGSSSSSSSPTSPYYQHYQQQPRRPPQQRVFRKIDLPSLVHLELHSFNGVGALRGSRSNLALQGVGLGPTSSSSASHRPGANGSRASPPSMARFLYLLSTPDIESLTIGGLAYDEWVSVADMAGLPRNIRRINGIQGVPSGQFRMVGGTATRMGQEMESGVNQRIFPRLARLEVDLIDA